MSGSATNQNGPVGHTGSFNFRGSLAAATAGDRPQATAGDCRRPQATDRRRPQASKRERSKKASRLDYTALKRHPALSQRLGASRTSERRRWVGGGEWRPSQGGSAQRRANDRGNGDFPLHATGSHGPDAI